MYWLLAVVCVALLEGGFDKMPNVFTDEYTGADKPLARPPDLTEKNN